MKILQNEDRIFKILPITNKDSQGISSKLNSNLNDSNMILIFK